MANKVMTISEAIAAAAEGQTITLEDVIIIFDSRTTEKWNQLERKIPKGFPCVEFGDNTIKLKIGDGIHSYSELPYIGDVDLSEYSTTEEMNGAITKAIKEAFEGKGTLFVLKGRVEDMQALEALVDTAEEGYVYWVGADGLSSYPEYYFNGTRFEYMGSTNDVDLTNYYKKSEVNELLAEKIGKNDTLILHCSLPETE